MLSAVNVGVFNALKLWPETWVANTAYTLGDIVKPTTYTSSSPAEGSRYSYKCTARVTDYKSGASEPTWGTTIGGTTTDNKITWTCYDGKTYQVKAPQGSSVPYVCFGLETDRPIGDFSDSYTMEDLTYWINAFSDVSTAAVSELADEVMTAMDGATLTVSGYNHLNCKREFTGTVIWDSEAGIFQIPLRYRLWENKA